MDAGRHDSLNRNVLSTWILTPAACLIAAACLLPHDVPISRFFRHGTYPHFVGDVLQNAEPFGHGVGVAFIVITVLALDPRARWLSPALALSALSGGMAANMVKLLVQRTRPRNFDLLHGVWFDTFGGWLPLLSRSAAGQSFPSAHTATAVGLAVMLCAAFPRGRWWFVTLAVLVGLQRIQASAHYPSDVCVGAALGWLAGQACVVVTERWRYRQTRTDSASDVLPLRRAA